MESNELLAYTAGIIDGEGCISIHRTTDAGKFYYRLRVFVKHTDGRLTNFLQRNFQGHINEFQPKIERHSRTFCWIIYGKEAESFLLQIFKYMVLKRKQAGIAFCFANIEFGQTGEQFYQMMKKANEKGPKGEF